MVGDADLYATNHLTLERKASEAVVLPAEPGDEETLHGEQHHHSSDHVGDIVPDATTVLVDGVFIRGQCSQEVWDRVEAMQPAVFEAGVFDDVALREVPSSNVHDACDDIVESPERREAS